MNPEISIIIPVYNTERYVARALESALGQTERNIEVVVVDDGSTDTTREVVESFSDERIRFFINEHNRGPSFTRNRAIQEARGEWIAPLDSDDWYAPNRLEKLLQVARVGHTDMVADDVHLIEDGDDHPWGTLLSLGGGNFDKFRHVGAVEFVDLNIPEKRCSRLGLTKPLMRRSFLVENSLGYDESVRGGDEDFHFYLACLLQGARFVVLPEPYYFYRDREGSLGSGDGNRLKILCARHASNKQLLQREFVKDNVDLAKSLSERLAALEYSISYSRIVQPLKQGNFSKALATVVRDPGVLKLLAKSTLPILYYRFYSRLRRSAGRVLPVLKLNGAGR